MPKCELCGQDVKTTQGLRGHMTFKHGVIGGGKQPVATLATEQQLSSLDGRVELTELQTEWLADELKGTDEQLKHVTEQLKDLYERLELVQTGKEELAKVGKELERVEADIKGKYRGLVELVKRLPPVIQRETDGLYQIIGTYVEYGSLSDEAEELLRERLKLVSERLGIDYRPDMIVGKVAHPDYTYLENLDISIRKQT